MKRPHILGAVLAGGLSTRFGSDKALALLDGQRLLDRAVEALAAQCDAVVVIGRDDARHDSVPDWPMPGLGPLGGLAGAFRHARERGYDLVLSCGVDSIGLPADLTDILAPASAYLKDQPVVGLWSISTQEALEPIIANDGKHSVMRFAEAAGARPVTLDRTPANVNRPEDLERLRDRKD